MLRYRFSEFVVSPGRRVLARNGRELTLIPRYFDLLVLLIQRRHEAVHKRDIFEHVWADVTVSDSALSQAIRTIRRTLGDDSREPRFIRTVSRHGYRFVFADVIEEEDDGELLAASPQPQDSVDVSPAAVPEPAEAIGPLAIAGRRSLAGAAGAGAAGGLAGALGGLTLAAIPESRASFDLVPVLAVIGAASAALGGAGVAAGLSAADLFPRSRSLASILCAAIGGAIVGSAVQWLARWSLAAIVGVTVPVGGGLEGLVIGGAAGGGHALFGHGSRRREAILTALVCGLAGAALCLAGRPLVGGTMHAIAQVARGSQITLDPLGRLIGETGFGPITQAIVGFSEAAFFGFGLVLGRRR